MNESTKTTALQEARFNKLIAERRWQRVEFAATELASLLTSGKHPGYQVIEDGLPANVLVIGLAIDKSKAAFVLVVAHETFRQQSEKSPVPFRHPVVRTL